MSYSEPVAVREFTSEGLQYARGYLESIRDVVWKAVPDELLFGDEYATLVTPSAQVETRSFENRRELGQYLAEQLEPLGAGNVSSNWRLLSWLGIFYLESITGGAKGQAPKRLFSDIAHIIDPSRDSRDRSHHRLKMAYDLWTRWSDKAWYFLEQPANSMPQFTLRIVQSPEIMRSEDLVPLTLALYVDKGTGELRPGSTGMNRSDAPPGSLPRLIAVLNQLSMTYDVYGMTMQQLLPLLPPEFDDFRAHAAAV